MKYFLHNASDMHVVDASGCSGQHCFRQKVSDKNHTGLSPLGISAIHGFVLTSDQVHSEGSMIIGLIVGTYFSHVLAPIHMYLGLSKRVVVSQALQGVLCAWIMYIQVPGTQAT